VVVHAATFIPNEQRVKQRDFAVNDRLRRETRWPPRFPTYKDGLAQVVSEWGERLSKESRDGSHA
jgi:nucleoside-diphosphate-sugar epimerase